MGTLCVQCAGSGVDYTPSGHPLTCFRCGGSGSEKQMSSSSSTLTSSKTRLTSSRSNINTDFGGVVIFLLIGFVLFILYIAAFIGLVIFIASAFIIPIYIVCNLHSKKDEFITDLLGGLFFGFVLYKLLISSHQDAPFYYSAYLSFIGGCISFLSFSFFGNWLDQDGLIRKLAVGGFQFFVGILLMFGYVALARMALDSATL